MPRNPSTKDKQMRIRLAQEAARIIAEEGLRDYYAAKRKAALHLGAEDTRNLPRNSEIEEALAEYHRLFHPESHPQQLNKLREAALQAMQLLDPFSPRLVGSVLSGSAGQHSDVNLHLFADTPENVVFFLMEHDIPFEERERRLRINGGEKPFPAYRFLAGEVPIELIVFPADGIRQAPLSPVDGKPMRRASITALELLMAEEEEAPAVV